MSIDFYTLRKLAEEAAGMRNMDLCLVSGTTGWDVESAPAGGCTSWGGPTIRSDDDDKSRPYPDSVTISIPGMPPNTELAKGHGFDAVFWSESAWEKFIKPYYCHLMTTKDLHTMWGLFTVPIGPPALPQILKVVALAHAPKSEPNALSGPAVVYTFQGKVKIAPTYVAFRQDLQSLGLL